MDMEGSLGNKKLDELHLVAQTGEKPKEVVENLSQGSEGQISSDEFTEETKDNSMKICFDGFMRSKNNGSTDEATFQVCVELGEKLFACSKGLGWPVRESLTKYNGAGRSKTLPGSSSIS